MTENPYRVAVLPIERILHSEEVDERNVRQLVDTILHARIWSQPIPVEAGTGIIMDGNHRARAAALLGLNYIPCVLLDYEDPRVSVSHWRTDAPFCIEQIRRRILTEKRLFPYKTTRHRFTPLLPAHSFELSSLM